MNPESSTRHEAHPLTVAIGGGGTGGHISPAIAVAAELRSRGPVTLFWLGSHTGFEGQAAQAHDIPFYPVRTGKLRRYLALETAVDAFRVPAGVFEARRLLKRLRPDVVFSTGGFVSTPSVMAACLLGIPALTHEQTASLGLATRINARFCDVVALSFPGNEKIRTRHGARVVLTGNPVRPSVLNGDHATLRSLYDIHDGLPVIYVTGGAQGAHALNTVVADALAELTARAVVIHQCGPQAGNGDYQRLLKLRDDLNPDMQDRYFPLERVGDELAHVYASSTLVIGRSGAGTVAELATLGIPSILVPLPGAEEQRRNARMLADAGGAVILDQSELSSDRLVQKIDEIVSDGTKLEAMRCAARSIVVDDPAARIVDELLALTRNS